MKRIYKILTFAALLLGGTEAYSQRLFHPVDSIKGSKFRPEEKKEELVIVGKDTISNIIVSKDYGRYNRGLFNYLYLPKGEWMMELVASYGSFDSEDIKFLGFLDNLDFAGRTFSIKPSVAYVFKHNNALGLRFGYSKSQFDLNSLKLDIMDDLSFDLKDVRYHTKKYSAELFFRHYLGLDNDRRFAVFNEISLGLAGGGGNFIRMYNDKPRDTRTDNVDLRLNFSPGVNVFLHKNASVNLSFGVFGWYLTRSKQTTDGTEEGSRITSGSNFKFNIFNINFGIAVHI